MAEEENENEKKKTLLIVVTTFHLQHPRAAHTHYSISPICNALHYAVFKIKLKPIILKIFTLFCFRIRDSVAVELLRSCSGAWSWQRFLLLPQLKF
jgi:hypothetical protein